VAQAVNDSLKLLPVRGRDGGGEGQGTSSAGVRSVVVSDDLEANYSSRRRGELRVAAATYRATYGAPAPYPPPRNRACTRVVYPLVPLGRRPPVLILRPKTPRSLLLFVPAGRVCLSFPFFFVKTGKRPTKARLHLSHRDAKCEKRETVFDVVGHCPFSSATSTFSCFVIFVRCLFLARGARKKQAEKCGGAPRSRGLPSTGPLPPQTRINDPMKVGPDGGVSGRGVTLCRVEKFSPKSRGQGEHMRSEKI